MPPDGVTPGVPTWYASTCRECPAGCGIHVKTREGRVIKVEGNPDSPVNRGKLGVVIDLTTEKGQSVFKRLARGADIVIENFRPGVMARLGLDYEAIRKENERVIYASISGHGQTGPWANKGGFDLIAQGLSGLMSVTGSPTSGPVKVGVPITDLGAALFATVGILGAFGVCP